MSGRRKLRRDHNSARLFCSGVPVSRRRLEASYDFKALFGERGGGIMDLLHCTIRTQVCTVWDTVHVHHEE